ncbi:uncharacterized protein PADG_08093 [Paracoccidioides brasiliensis Pb18]|uniref:USP domain-containing protein n=1 Tax=Paracoccidioides brasiliensis (strain Pb18) TaxID=502780 RepID=C1GLF7_PARBD|nr:uncharacterized protein PADG_08093 [Paracoccidioides brasiliensis Pb18]EEH43273.2 hypothetical protein PADG_08093 [Paracoccidioides brasiliensis Pb18]
MSRKGKSHATSGNEEAATYNGAVDLGVEAPEKSNVSGNKEAVSHSRQFKWNREYMSLLSRGMPNENNVLCYRNSAFISLLHSPVFVNWLRARRCISGNEANPDCLAFSWDMYSKLYWSNTIQADTLNSHMTTLWNKHLLKLQWGFPEQQGEDIIPQQEDVVEFLTYLIGSLAAEREEHGNKREKKYFEQMFRTSLLLTRTCLGCTAPKCDSETRTSNILYAIPPPLMAQTRRIEEGIATYLENEALLDRVCTTCHIALSPADTARIRRAPEILIVQVDRFKVIDNKSMKVFTNLTFGEELDLTSHYDNTGDNTGEGLRYQLVSVIFHLGLAVEEGHYITFAKQPNGVWSKIDDEKVTKIQFNDIADGSHGWNETPYVFFYSRIYSEPQASGTEKASQLHASKTSPGVTQEGEDDHSALASRFYDFFSQTLSEKAGVSTPRSKSTTEQPAQMWVNITMGNMALTGTLQGRLDMAVKRLLPTDEPGDRGCEFKKLR